MNRAYAIGRITVKDETLWAAYRAKVPATLEPWGGELVFRGTQFAALAGLCPEADVVVVRFPNAAALRDWFASAAYQALIPLREAAAEVVLTAYES
ncbi:DUF1330 domain-containing protein [Thauera linaloolentis]|uniref:DUF1330 domain-containing protein n=1 Tax=Thauera linaloolentis (strain DSM 12138 / JCM 21573 / CCUG 41526 / CIP 105981 / IAM 15112 / NBRC 102519 / 47Lol) TaxID=1123367 RepID=N6Z443_THAL4|nr:DUF1330 domain-containing protein [Thauera linaloolentis]ENO89198.1 hypothetical protein C666_07045 [Thauera linaloolentis 47Lol = DSM 12138]MCM8564321.1 DUF1330 domain-containing protein [Thauera linaloolentis]